MTLYSQNDFLCLGKWCQYTLNLRNYSVERKSHEKDHFTMRMYLRKKEVKPT